VRGTLSRKGLTQKEQVYAKWGHKAPSVKVDEVRGSRRVGKGGTKKKKIERPQQLRREKKKKRGERTFKVKRDSKRGGGKK